MDGDALAIVALGSNIEPRRERLERALAALAALPGTRLVKASSMLDNDGVDVPPEFAHMRFLNQVAAFETSLEVHDFSRRMHAIEDVQGRVRTGVRNAPRTIDLDLIAFGDLVLDEPELVLPHPRARERAFVTVPLKEILPAFQWPPRGFEVLRAGGECAILCGHPKGKEEEKKMNKLTADELREIYLGFFESKGHARIQGASVIPENDPTVLFTTAGMHPLVPYLMGQMPHPAGTRLTDVQKCVRTGDIDAVGDSAHLTFFEMLGNWSLNDYFKPEAIAWSYEFLTTKLGFDPKDLYVTVFAGEDGIPRDEEAIALWKQQGLPDDHIFPLPREDNWWGPAGTTGPCGPDTEMFIDTGKPKCGPDCRPGCHCGKYIEIWNNVFMQYNKNAEGKFEPLGRHNVDTGMGVERTVCMLSGAPTVFDTEIFAPIMAKIDELSTMQPEDPEQALRARRIIADHMRTATFILCDPKGGVKPGNIGANYVLRRLIRRAVRYSRFLGIAPGFTVKLAETICEKYRHVYPELAVNLATCKNDLEAEENRFNQTLDKGAAMFAKVAEQLKLHNQTQISGKTAFKLYDTFGYPLEMTLELAREQGLEVDVAGFEEANKKHQELSRTTSAGSFKAGLQDNSAVVTRMHTATHLLHAALHKVLGPTANQKGSNITPERLRFDFTWPEKMTDEQIKAVEELVNQWIKDAIPVTKKTTTVEEAKNEGAMALFGSKYGDQVSLYSIGDVSKEICCGPHVENTSELGSFKITKEQSSSAGVRRIKAVIGNLGD